MSSLGIYFGPKLINIVETKGRKPVRDIEVPQTTISAGELEEKVPADVKTIEIIALFKDELRRNKIDAREATICLSGKDLIIRTFEIPQMPREELQGAVNFEVKKYIPFKIEELISTFQVVFLKASRTNFVLFIGIKKDIFEKYVSILNQLNIKISAIEYSGFSILRCLKLAGISENGVVAILGADLDKQDEANFVVSENGFPLFSRDITLSGGPEELAKMEEAGPQPTALEKLKREIRVSLDYYQRKFPTKNIKKMVIISNLDCRSDLETFMTEAGLSVHFFDVARYIDRAMVYSLSFIKGYSASLFKTIKSNLKVDLLAAREKARALKERTLSGEGASLIKGLKLDFRMLAAGLLICIATAVFGIFRMVPLHNEINMIIAKRPQLTIVSPQAAYEELTQRESEYKRKLDVLDRLVKGQLYLTPQLNLIPRAIPDGVWLRNLNFFKREEGKNELVLEGMTYLGDSDKEFAAVNQFLSNLKKDPDFVKYFKEISIDFLDRRQSGKVTATNFSISCKTYQGRQ